MSDAAIELAKKLQRDLAIIDLLSENRLQASSGYAALLVLKLQQLKLKMYQEKGHKLPHLHVDYGADRHAASYSIDPPHRLEGELGGRYESSVLRFIIGNQQQLLELWAQMQAGADCDVVLAELRDAVES